MVGERVYRSFWPKALYNLDAEDTANMIDVGQTDHGETVRDQEARRRVRPDRLRQHQPRRDGRWPQVGGGRARRLQEPASTTTTSTRCSTRSRYMDPREGHSAINDSVEPDGPAARRRRRQDLPDRDHDEHRDVPVAARLPEQARVGVVGQGPGADGWRQEGQRPRRRRASVASSSAGSRRRTR